jgi:hypothetical protein
MGKIERIQAPPDDRERLVRLVRDHNTPQKIVWRSQIVLLTREGIGAVEVATRVGKSVLVRRRRRRYAAKGVDGLLKDAIRSSGRKPLGLQSSPFAMSSDQIAVGSSVDEFSVLDCYPTIGRVIIVAPRFAADFVGQTSDRAVGDTTVAFIPQSDGKLSSETAVILFVYLSPHFE